MARLISPLGIVVNVSDEKAARLGWEPVEGQKPKPGRPKKQPKESDK